MARLQIGATILESKSTEIIMEYDASGKEHDATSIDLPVGWHALQLRRCIRLGLAVDSCEKEDFNRGTIVRVREMSEEKLVAASKFLYRLRGGHVLSCLSQHGRLLGFRCCSW